MRVRVLEALPRETSPPCSANAFAVALLKPSSRERLSRLRRLNFVHSCYARNLKRDHIKKKAIEELIPESHRTRTLFGQFILDAISINFYIISCLT